MIEASNLAGDLETIADNIRLKADAFYAASRIGIEVNDGEIANKMDRDIVDRLHTLTEQALDGIHWGSEDKRDDFDEIPF